MKPFIGPRLVCFLLCVAAAPFARAADVRPIHVLELNDQIISPVTQDYITEGITRAEDQNAACLIIVMDTPGGLLESTRTIIKHMMSSRVPIVVYVSPAGSRAGSAGVFITLAANIAAMAPYTHIGAAHPVTIGGGDSELFRKKEPGKGEKGKNEGSSNDNITTSSVEAEAQKLANPMAAKILNDTLAWVRNIAKARGRNVEWAEKAVTESVSVTAEEALKIHVIDLIADNLNDLVKKINGRTVKILGRDVTLHTTGAEIQRYPMNALQQFLAVITHPNVAYILMMLGTLGLIFEFTHPGIGFPGIAGAICLLLALYSFQVLPVSYVALALMLAGVAMLILEIKVTSYGLLAVGGIVCLTLGGLMLFQSPQPALRVSLSVVLPTVLTMAGITLFLVHRVIMSRKFRVATGDQGMVGEIGQATTDLNPEGFVFVHGETWKAECETPLARGTKVRVVRVSGLRIFVEPAVPESTQL